MIKRAFLSFTIILLLPLILFAQQKNSKPKVNQVGYYPESIKLAVTPDTDATTFYIRDIESDAIIFEGSLASTKYYGPGDESVKIADFSGFGTFGKFVIGIYGEEESYPFTIGNNIYSELSDGVLKAFYYNRASTALSEEFAGKWDRALGHPDNEVLIHNSAASANRPANSTISSPKGWYDAGDFNKYVVPISSSISQLLFAYEEFPEYFSEQNLNIPESDNNIPDILDESLWALRWLFTMQDPDDGGVYHKLTTSNFQGTVMPDVPTATRYVVQKGTAATYDFAAVMAHAARVYKSFLPDFADSALAAATDAWAWGNANSNVAYNQGNLSNPAINTGTYGDGSFTDEKFWAASELYITTGDESYYMDGGWNSAGVVGWNSVRGLGLFSMVANRTQLSSVGLADTTSMIQKVKSIADSYINPAVNSAYRSPFGTGNNHFFWGSNGFAGNIGLVTMLAYRVSGEQKYYDASIDVLDFIMGRNPLDQSFITGFGSNPPMHIHHRQSAADGIADPVPGWVAGGANPGNQNQDCGTSAYNSSLPALSYLDNYCSYSTNEITTYWNSPFIYVLAGLESLTPEATSMGTKTGFFKGIDTAPLYNPGDSIDIAWTLLNENFSGINLYYKTLINPGTVLIKENISLSDSLFNNFIIPPEPGEQILFRVEDIENPDLWFQSGILSLQPPKSLTFTRIEANAGFEPNKTVFFEWTSVSVDSVDLLYRLEKDEVFTIIFQNRDADIGSFSFGFRVPDAPGERIIFRLKDSNEDTIYTDSEPILISTPVSNEHETKLSFKLNQNYPNPFNPTTTIDFELSKVDRISLSIFSSAGQEIARLISETLPAGKFSIMWDASDVASGVYYYRLESSGEVLTRKMTLIK